jgi:hypothetical protein
LVSSTFRSRRLYQTLLIAVLAAVLACVPAIARAQQHITSKTPVQEGSRFSNTCESAPNKASVGTVVIVVRVAASVAVQEHVPAWRVTRPDNRLLSPQASVSPHALRAPPASIA